MMFIVADQDYAAAVKALHTDLIENNSDWEAVQSA